MVNRTPNGKENYDLREDFKRWKTEGNREFEKLSVAKKAALMRNGGFLNRLFRYGADEIERSVDKNILDLKFKQFHKLQSQACKSDAFENEGSSEEAFQSKKDTAANNRKRTTLINTPLNTRQLPRIITPKVTSVTEIQARVLEPDEIAFSVTGSPVVVAPAKSIDEEAQQIADLLEMNEEDFTPETRKVVNGLRTVMRKLQK